MNSLFQRLIFAFRYKYNYIYAIILYYKKFLLRLQGMQIGKGTFFEKIYISWPHQVSIGKNCILENGVYFKYDGIWEVGPRISISDNCFLGAHVEFNIKKSILINNYCLIASGCKFIDHDHGYKKHDIPMSLQGDGVEMPIVLEEDVWLGVNVVILKGVTIGKGAIVAAGSVVSKSIPSYEIWAGIPARKISNRPI